MIRREWCPCCASTDATQLISLPFDDPRMSAFLARYYGGRAGPARLAGFSYDVKRCHTCEFMWQVWILDDEGMRELYGTWISSDTSLAKRQSAAYRLQTARHCARLLALFDGRPARVLDYGMGWGDWCLMARAFGFDVAGVELSAERVAHARAQGIDAWLPGDLPETPFDFVNLEQVLEHVPDPSALLKILTARVADGGYIHVAVPDAGTVRFLRKPDPKSIPGLLAKGPAQPLEHINLFTHASLTRAMKRLGYAPVSERDLLARTASLRAFIRDAGAAFIRSAGLSLRRGGTNLLFRKGHGRPTGG